MPQTLLWNFSFIFWSAEAYLAQSLCRFGLEEDDAVAFSEVFFDVVDFVFDVQLVPALVLNDFELLTGVYLVSGEETHARDEVQRSLVSAEVDFFGAEAKHRVGPSASSPGVVDQLDLVLRELRVR